MHGEVEERQAHVLRALKSESDEEPEDRNSFYNTGRQLLKSQKLNELRQRSLAPSQFIKNYKLSAAMDEGTCRHSE